MSRIRRILVVVDPRAVGRQSAVDKAAVLARCMDASLQLLMCDVASVAVDDADPSGRSASSSDAHLLNMLDELAAPVRAAGLDVMTRLIYGNSLPDSLLDYIRGADFDLVAKDTHHHSFLKRTLIRNTDWYLARGCAAPLLLTKSRPWNRRPIILAAIDPSPSNDAADELDRHILHYAATLTGQIGGELHVIHSFVPVAFESLVVAAGTPNMSREYSEALQVEKSYKFCQIEQLVSRYRVPRQNVHLEMGTTEDCLMSAVTEYRADIMVMGASSHARWHRRVVGSTASTVLEALPCDALIVQPCHESQAVPV